MIRLAPCSAIIAVSLLFAAAACDGRSVVSRKLLYVEEERRSEDAVPVATNGWQFRFAPFRPWRRTRSPSREETESQPRVIVGEERRRIEQRVLGLGGQTPGATPPPSPSLEPQPKPTAASPVAPLAPIEESETRTTPDAREASPLLSSAIIAEVSPSPYQVVEEKPPVPSPVTEEAHPPLSLSTVTEETSPSPAEVVEEKPPVPSPVAGEAPSLLSPTPVTEETSPSPAEVVEEKSLVPPPVVEVGTSPSPDQEKSPSETASPITVADPAQSMQQPEDPDLTLLPEIGTEELMPFSTEEEEDRQTSKAEHNNRGHHIGRNMKIASWTMAGICLSLVVIGNFLGLYYSYIRPRTTARSEL